MAKTVSDLLELAEMEEHFGSWWHRYITRKSLARHPEAEVRLNDMDKLLGMLFRALGGDGGLEICASDTTLINARRTLLQKVAGTHKKAQLAWRDDTALYLPPSLDHFPEQSLNRHLYLWLAALAAMEDPQLEPLPWFTHNQRLTLAALERFPGLQTIYRELVAAHLQQRKRLPRLPRDEALQEQAIRTALADPGSQQHLPPAQRMPAPVPLWLHPNPPHSTTIEAQDPKTAPGRSKPGKESEEVPRKQTEKADTPESDRGLITVRMENIFSWGEHVNVDRGTDDEEDDQRAEEVARDLDKVAVTRNGEAAKTRIKFDLDLPAEAEDDAIIDDGLLLPEWHWKQRRLIPNHCRVVELLATDAQTLPLPERLRKTANRLRNQFQAFAPARVWHRGQPEGQEIDLDSYLRFVTDRASGCTVAGDNLYREMRSGARDLACLLLADLSLSTDTWVNDHARVLDVIQDSLFLFAESLTATGDAFGIYGFSSRKRDPIRVHRIKSFSESYNGQIRGRIAALKPGYYTRMGAGIRFATEQLKQQGAGRRLLLLLTDGKPNDLDQYEGRYGVEDTREAIRAARRIGFHPFCVTIDQKGSDYLPHLFGNNGFVVIRNPTELPAQLPLLYARLTADQL